METKIYLRPLVVDDAKTSFKWRNDPQIWKYTNFVAKESITPEIENQWITNVLERKNERRYAICVSDTDQYIGNVQLLDINNNAAEFHVFIGEKDYWGKGVGFQATKQILAIAFETLKLENVFLDVHPANIIAIRCYRRAGFEVVGTANEKIKMMVSMPSFSN